MSIIPRPKTMMVKCRKCPRFITKKAAQRDGGICSQCITITRLEEWFER